MGNQQTFGKSRIQSAYKAIKDRIYCSVIRPLVVSHNTPDYDALGVALGLGVGLGAPLGSHMLFLGLLRLIFKFNVVVAFGFTFVVNPINAVPLYYGYYLLGSYALGEPASLSFDNFRKTVAPVMNSEYFWESMSTFFRLSGAVLLRWLTAGISLAVVIGALGYTVTYSIQKKRLHRTAARLGLEYRNLVAKLGARDSTRGLASQDKGDIHISNRL
ncbi:MAG: DUF2062 domain-containing protein [Desulfomonilaceae bacterium]